MAGNPLKTIRLLFLIMLLIGMTGCEQPPESSWAPGDALKSTSASGESVDTGRYMVADELLGRLSAGEHPFVFDVRARASFEESHVEGAYSMPYGQVGEAELAEIQGLGKKPDCHLLRLSASPGGPGSRSIDRDGLSTGESALRGLLVLA